MLWALLAVVPIAFIVVPRFSRGWRERAGPTPAWTVPIARLEAPPPSRRRVPSKLVAMSGPLGVPAPLKYYGLSTLGLTVLVLVVLVGLMAIVMPGWRG
jgi:hypothetical protein